MIFSAVIFDLDGLLIDTETVSKQAWMQGAADYSFEFTEALYAQIAGTSINHAKTKIADSLPALDIKAYMEHSSKLYYQSFERQGIAVMMGVREIIDFLDQNSIQMAVATSSAKPSALLKLEISGLIEHFEVIVTRDCVDRGKPAPDLFLLTAELLAVPANECIVIEDAEPGILGAHKANMRSIMVPSTVRPSASIRKIALAIEPSLLTVIPTLRRLLRGSENALV